MSEIWFPPPEGLTAPFRRHINTATALAVTEVYRSAWVCWEHTEGHHPGKETATLKLSLRDELGVTQAKDVGRAVQGEDRASSKERPAWRVPEPLAIW